MEQLRRVVLLFRLEMCSWIASCEAGLQMVGAEYDQMKSENHYHSIGAPNLS